MTKELLLAYTINFHSEDSALLNFTYKNCLLDIYFNSAIKYFVIVVTKINLWNNFECKIGSKALLKSRK